MKTSDRRGSIHVAWVVVVHPIDIRPYLDLIRHECRPHKCRRIVAPSSLEVIDVSECIATDVALGDEEACTLGSMTDQTSQVTLDEGLIRLGLLVRTHVF